MPYPSESSVFTSKHFTAVLSCSFSSAAEADVNPESFSSNFLQLADILPLLTENKSDIRQLKEKYWQHCCQWIFREMKNVFVRMQ